MDEFDPRADQQIILMEQLNTLNTEESELLAAFSTLISEEAAYLRSVLAIREVERLSTFRQTLEEAVEAYRQRAADLRSEIHAVRQQKQQLRSRLSEFSR